MSISKKKLPLSEWEESLMVLRKLSDTLVYVLSRWLNTPEFRSDVWARDIYLVVYFSSCSYPPFLFLGAEIIIAQVGLGLAI